MTPYVYQCEADDCKRIHWPRNGGNPTGSRDLDVAGDPGEGRRYHSECVECGWCDRPATTTRADVGHAATEPADGPLCDRCADLYDAAPLPPAFGISLRTHAGGHDR